MEVYAVREKIYDIFLIHKIMIALGIILMFVGGAIFAVGEQGSCLLMIVGGVINFTGLGMLISAF